MNYRPGRCATRLTHLKEKGVTLIELLIGLGVISLLALIALTFLTGILSKSTVNETSNLMSGLVSEARVAFKNDTLTTTNFTAAILINNKIAPKDMISGTTLKSPYGAVTVAPGTGAGQLGGGQTMQFTLAGVPKEDCSNLVRALDPFSNQITVGSTIVKAYEGSVDKAVTGTACNPATGTLSVIIRTRVR